MRERLQLAQVHRLRRREPGHTVYGRARIADRAGAEIRGDDTAAQDNGGDGHGRGCWCEPRADPPAEALDLDRPLEALERRGAQRIRDAADRRVELAARRAGVEVRPEQHDLEPRQLAVDFSSCPLAGAVTGCVHDSHDSSDGGGYGKLVRAPGLSLRGGTA